MLGHNQPSFDQIVEENLLRGLYLSQLNALTRAVKDPRLSARHVQVLAAIIERTNSRSGVAYPGRARLANELTFYVNGEPQRYTERTIGQTISELIEFGYIMAARRTPDGGGRQLSHYVTVAPSIEDLQAAIAEWCIMVRGQPKPDFSSFKQRDDNNGVAVNKAVGTSDDNPSIDDKNGVAVSVDDNPVPAVDDNPVGDTVTGKRTGKEIRGEDFFEAFWQAFPKGRKQSKGEARLIFERITLGKHKVGFATAAELVAGAKRYAAAKPDPQYTKMPSTWLNQGCWMDDLPEAPSPRWWHHPEKVREMTLERWQNGIAEYGQEFWSVEQLGPSPGTAGCVVRPEWVQELRLTEIYDGRGMKR